MFISTKKKSALVKRRTDYADALNKSLKIFVSYTEKAIDDVMSNGLHPVADVASIDRIIVFRINGIESNTAGEIYRWDKEKGGTAPIDPVLKLMPVTGVLKRWVSIMSNDTCISLKRSKFTEEEAAFLSPRGVQSILIVPVFTERELWGIVTFHDNANERDFDEDCARMLRSTARLCASTIIRDEKTKEADRVIEKLKRHEECMGLLNKTAVFFLSQGNKPVEIMMSEGIKPIFDMINIDRFSVFRHYTAVENSRTSQIYRWERESGGFTQPNKDFVDISYTQYIPDWEFIFSQKKTVNGPVHSMPETESATLKSIGAVSAFAAPIFINNVFWGFALFEDHHNERYFDEDYVELMQSTAFLCANTIQKSELERVIKEVEALKHDRDSDERIRIMLNATPMACRLWDKNYKILDCNDEVVNLFHVKDKYEYMLRHFEFSPEYQPDGQRSLDATFKILEKVFAEGRCVFEWMHQDIAGELIPCEITLVRVEYKGDYIVAGYTRDLRELKTAQTEAQESDERMRIMLDATPLSCSLIDKNYNFIDCNKAAEKLFKVSSKQEYIYKFFDFSPERQPDGQESKEKAFNLFKQTFDEGYAYFEWEHLIDGEKVPCNVSLVRVKYKDDYIIAGYTNDLREIRAAIEKMSEADERTRLIFDTAPIGSLMFDKDFKIMDCNQEIVKMFGIKDKQFFLENFFNLSPEYQPCGKKSIELSTELNETTFKKGYNRFEWLHWTSGGELMPCEIIQVRVKFRDEYVITAYVRDLREHKALIAEIDTEKEKHKAQAHWYESILDAIPFFVSAQDLNGRCTFINAEAERFLGNKKNEIMDTPCRNWGFSICDTENCAMECAKRGRMRTHFMHKNDSYQVDTKLMKDMNNNTSGFIEVIQDITKMERLAKQQAEAEAASIAKSSFLSSMSHEMRTPMNAIIGMVTIGKNASDIERKNYALNKIEDASKHLLGVINDVLDMSKIEANKLELSHVTFDLKQSLHRAVSLIQFNMENKQLNFTMNMADNTPSLLFGDDQRLTQVIMNLLSNAVKFTDKGGSITLNAALTGENDGICELRFEVTDSGRGIEPEQHEKIFRPFEQAESGITRKYGGTGLGLVISKRIVELMDGNIWVESELGKGARFIFTVKLPRDTKDASAGDGIVQDISSNKANDKLKGKKLLIVEDIEINREILITLLDGTGLVLDTAENGKEALDMVCGSPDKYDLIFMDVQMPVMDGFEATRNIRAISTGRQRKLPIIAMTANVFQEDINKCLEAGMDDHVGKPLDIDNVLDKLREYL